MSVVNMVPTHRNWLSSDDIIAARIPADNSPATNGVVSAFTAAGKTALGGKCAGMMSALVIQTPNNTHGTHTIMMKIGCATTASLKLSALFAVSQC